MERKLERGNSNAVCKLIIVYLEISHIVMPTPVPRSSFSYQTGTGSC
jgi:hypothetical protein